MNSNILATIKLLCDDIAGSTNLEENKKRAEAIALLSSLDDTVSNDCDRVRDNNVYSNIPKPGETFTYNNMEFIALGKEQGGILAIMACPLDKEMQYDKEDGENDWKKSTLRKYLNGEFLEKFNKGDLLSFVSDLTSDDGMKDYGTSEDFIALISCDLYRKYCEFMPEYDTWIWTITPRGCRPRSTGIECFVFTDGSLSYDYTTNANGVVPACIFNRSIFK